jgi:serine/threonine protein kinase
MHDYVLKASFARLRLVQKQELAGGSMQIIHLKAERDVLRMVNHPGVVNFLGGFQDAECVYFVMEYVSGGEFFRHLRVSDK